MANVAYMRLIKKDYSHEQIEKAMMMYVEEKKDFMKGSKINRTLKDMFKEFKN